MLGTAEVSVEVTVEVTAEVMAWRLAAAGLGSQGCEARYRAADDEVGSVQLRR